MNMKILVTLFLVFTWFIPVTAQYDSDAAEKDRMTKAKVKTQTQWTHEYVDGKPSDKGYKSSVTKYNMKGNMTEVSSYNAQGKIILLVVYQYDNYENRVSFEQYVGNREKLQYSQKILYDAKGNKTREYGYDGVTVYNNTFQYDGNGKLSEISYTADNALVEKRQLKYSGNKTEILVYDQRNNLIFRQENTYNDKGLLLSEIRTGNKGNVVHTLDMQYNTVGDLTEELKKRADEQLDYQKLYEYDKDNRPVKEVTINADGVKFVSEENRYNNLGDLVFRAWKKNERTQESSTKSITYDSMRLYTEVESYFATYKLNSLYKYTYEFY